MRKLILLMILIPFLSFSQEKNYDKALKAYEKGNYREALRYLDKNLKKHPSSVESVLLKSNVSYVLDEFDKVVELLRHVGGLDTAYRSILSESLYETHQYEDAKEIYRSLLGHGEDEIIYCNMGASFCNLEIADSAIYYLEKAVELKPYDGMYRLNLGDSYAVNDEFDKACGQYFLASKLSYDGAAETYETENCDSWKEQWLDKISGSDWFTIENSMFPFVKDKVIVTHRTYLFEESGEERQLKLIGLTKLPTGAVFKFTDDEGHTFVRWADEKGNKDWTLKGVKTFDEL